MSEEILKAFMQLFAIIVKQDDGVTVEEKEYVRLFLHQQVSDDTVEEYYELFLGFLDNKNSKRKDEKESEENTKKKVRKLTSMKDSVRILSICKKINKTLTQKQKVVVLVRLFELVNTDKQFTAQRNQIIDTVADVFNISKEQFSNIENFVINDRPWELESTNILTVNGKPKKENPGKKYLFSKHLDGNIVILRVPEEDLYFLRYIGKNELFLNGLSLNTSSIYLFTNGGTIRPPIGKPIYFSDVVANFLSDEDSTRLSFNAKNIQFRYSGKMGLKDISISEPSGKLISIMGASGAGKTTLINVLSGIEKPSSGSVLINGIDIHKDGKKVEGVIGYIPQDDLLLEELTVYQNLYYNAKLCLKGLSDGEIDKAVISLLSNLGLLETRDLKVGNALNKSISGGQRKRLNIALELIREPSVLFVDEPTSGLSSKDSENVMDLLRELTLKGKLIFVVIHQPSSEIYKMFDKVVILDTGGYQIYYGNPVEAVMYFKRLDRQINSDIGECVICGNVNPELIFNIIEARIVDEFGHFTDKRKVLPSKWSSHYKENFKPEYVNDINDSSPKNLQIPNWFLQLKVYITRDFLSKVSDKQYLLINLIEAPLLALILSFIIRYIVDPESEVYIFRENDNIPAFIFMAILVASFIGLTVSAEEIFKDRKILKRESFLNLSRSSYLFSKICILFFLSAVQTLTFVLVSNAILEIKGMNIAYWATLFTVSCFGNILGLNISSTFDSAVTIYILIPLLLIPQMILGGAMFSYDKLNRSLGESHGIPYVADLMVTRWAYEALVVKQFLDNKYESRFYDLEKKESEADYMQVYYIPKLKEITEDCLSLLEGAQNNKKEKIFLDKLRLLEFELSRFKDLEYFGFNNQLNSFKSEFNNDIGKRINNFLDSIEVEYRRQFNLINITKDKKLSRLQETQEKTKLYKYMYNSYYNDYLGDLVKRRYSKNKIEIRNGKLVQIIDPIYNYPKPTSMASFRTHFYSPVKWFFGKVVETFNFNLAVIWAMSAMLYTTLYFDFFRKVLLFVGKRQFKFKVALRGS